MIYPEARFYVVSDTVISVELGDEISPQLYDRVVTLTRLLEKHDEQNMPALLETVPGYRSVMVEYDPLRADAQQMLEWLVGIVRSVSRQDSEPQDARLQSAEPLGAEPLGAEPLEKVPQQEASSGISQQGSGPYHAGDAGKTVDIPVCYGGVYGPDLPALARETGLSEQQVIALHSAGLYPVYMMGFMPGFLYLGGMDQRLDTPRLDTPRIATPAGSVGIAGGQTGIYPLTSPGGWRIIGRTPLRLFDTSRPQPFLLATGDRVRFMPIDEAEFTGIEEAAVAERERRGSNTEAAKASGGGARGHGVAVGTVDFGEHSEHNGSSILSDTLTDTLPAPTMLRIVNKGMLTTIQDGGRRGYQRFGVPVSGPMDWFAFRLANLLVGNVPGAPNAPNSPRVPNTPCGPNAPNTPGVPDTPNAPGAPTLEVTIRGPAVEVVEDCWFAVCGATFSLKLNGQAVPMNSRVFAAAGSLLEMGYATAGARGYVAFTGGIKVAPTLGSASTCPQAGLGGLDGSGQPLKDGDLLALDSPGLAVSPLDPAANLLSPALIPPCPASADNDKCQPQFRAGFLPAYSGSPRVRMVVTARDDQFAPQALEVLTAGSYTVGADSNRMGYRLEGAAVPYAPGCDGNILSEGVTMGCIQVVGGQPLVLMADCQTTGGYARIGAVIKADLPLVAQLRPGDKLGFEVVSLKEAQEACREMCVRLAGVCG